MLQTTAELSDNQARRRPAVAAAALACMGIVFGDIGTSPLYTLQVAVKSASPTGVIAPEAVLGIVSLVVLGRMTQGVPLPLSHNVNFNHVLHERVLLVAVEMTNTPRVDDSLRVTLTRLNERIARVQLRFGFMEKPDVPKGLRVAVEHLHISHCNLQQVTYFTGHETIIPTAKRTGMARWRKSLFALMHHNAEQPATYFNIPSAQVMEIGVEFEI